MYTLVSMIHAVFTCFLRCKGTQAVHESANAVTYE